MRKIMEASALSQLIGSIGKSRVQLNTDIQDAAEQCIAQSIVHRNATPATQLFDAVGNIMRRDALVAYFEKFGNLAWSKADKKVVFFDSEKIANVKLEWTDEYAEAVHAVAWVSLKKEPVPVSVYDAEAEASKFIARIKRLAADPAVTVKNKDLVGKLELVYLDHVRNGITAMPDEQQRELVDAAKTTAEAGVSPEKLKELEQKFN